MEPGAPLLRTLGPALLAVAFLATAGCGERPAPPAPAGPDDVVAAKPNPFLGGLQAQVVARESAEEATIVARLRPAAEAQACQVDLILPEGASLVEGEPTVRGEGPEIQATWRVRFPLGRTLDAVVRACGDTPNGMQAMEVSLRLTGGD